MKHSVLGASLSVVLVSWMIGGCAQVAVPVHTARVAATPVHFDAPRDDSREPARMTHASPAAAAKGDSPSAFYPPEVVHEARIELAREALDADNQAKAEAEEAEEMQRDIAESEASGTAHVHVKRAP